MKSSDLAIENVYLTFSDAPIPEAIEGCPHCVDDKNLEKLLTIPLRDLEPDDLSSYAASAFLTVGDVPDYLYFLPRILEISIKDKWWWPDIEITGRAITDADLPNWTFERRQALQELFSAVIEHFIDSDDFEPIDSWMCCIGKTALDVRPFLKMIETCPGAVLCYFNINAESLEGTLSNPFWELWNPGHDIIVDWFRSEKIAKISSAVPGSAT